MCYCVEICNRVLIAYPYMFLIGIFKSQIVSFTFRIQGVAVFLFYTVLVITPAVTVHGKTNFTGGNTDRQEVMGFSKDMVFMPCKIA